MMADTFWKIYNSMVDSLVPLLFCVRQKLETCTIPSSGTKQGSVSIGPCLQHSSVARALRSNISELPLKRVETSIKGGGTVVASCKRSTSTSSSCTDYCASANRCNPSRGSLTVLNPADPYRERLKTLTDTSNPYNRHFFRIV